MKKIKAKIENGRIIFDFEGFKGDACSREENAIRILYEKMGVKTDVEEESGNREKSSSGIVSTEGKRIGN